MTTLHPTPMRRLRCFVWLGCLLGAAACEGAKLQEQPTPLDALQLLPGTGTLEVGQSASLGALRLRDGVSTNVTSSVSWSSDDESVATVSYTPDAGAVVVAVAAGTAHIRASQDDKTASAEFVVIAEVAAVELDRSVLELAQGSELPLGAILIAADGNKRPQAGAATWASSDPKVASVDGDGVISARTAGDATITLVAGGLVAEQPIHVRAWTLDSVEVVAVVGTSLPTNAQTAIAVTGHFSGGHSQDLTRSFTFEIEDDGAPKDPDSEPVLTLEDAIVTAGATAGAATLIGTGKADSIAAGQSVRLDFSVTDAELTELTFEAPAKLSLQGELAPFVLTGVYADGLKVEIGATFTTEPEGIVYVDAATATVMPLALGTTRITAAVEVAGADADAEPTTIEVSHEIAVVDAALRLLIAEAPGRATPLPVGAEQALSVSATFGTDVVQDVTDAAVWSSSDEAIAVVSNVRSGVVTGVGSGAAMLTVRYRGQSVTLPVRVSGP